MRLLGEAMHRLGHTVEEESLGLFLAPVAVRLGDELFGLRNGKRGEEIGEDWFKRAAQPHVEEVR